MTRHRPAGLLLCALLLAAPAVSDSASAQMAIPATPGPVGGPGSAPTPGTAPVSTAPINTAPINPAPINPAPVLRLTAPVGTSAEYVTTVSTRVTVSDVRVSAVPGGGATEADLNDVRRAFAGNAGTLNRTQTQSGKAFYRVAGRRPDGSVRLVTTLVQGGAGAPAVTLSITQDLSPAGRGSNFSITSPDPQLAHALSALDDPQIQALTTQSGAATIYGTPLVAGQPRTTTATVDTQALLGGLIGALTGGALGQVEASPLSVTTTTTYRGSGPQGETRFGTRAAAGRWTFRVAGGPGTPELAFELSGLDASGTSSYRRDGLPGAATLRQQLRLNATLRQDGVQVRLAMTLDQTVELTPR